MFNVPNADVILHTKMLCISRLNVYNTFSQMGLSMMTWYWNEINKIFDENCHFLITVFLTIVMSNTSLIVSQNNSFNWLNKQENI